MTWPPPLAHVTGTVEPGEVFGGFGPSADIASQWRGSCVGGCGARPYAREESPTPTCLDCMRARHWPQGRASGVPIGTWRPIVAPERWSWRPWSREPVNQPAKLPVNQPAVTILRPAQEVSPCDASLPAAVRTLVRLADEHGRRPVRVTAAVAARSGLVVASIAVRVPGVGCAVYEREGDAWGFAGAFLLAPHLRRANVGQFRAALTGAEYVPPAPREPIRGCCVKCRAEVSITADGKIYASHRCGATKVVEGRS